MTNEEIKRQLRQIANTIKEQEFALRELGRSVFDTPPELEPVDEETVQRVNDALQHLTNAHICIIDLQYMDWTVEEATK